MIHKEWTPKGIAKNFIPIFILCLFALLIIGCTSGIITYQMVSKNNTHIKPLDELRIGMTKAKALNLMGTADKSETVEHEGGVVEILFYLTSGSYSPDRGWQNIDSTPLVFEGGVFKGMGENLL